jgi:hypothetical protein
MGMELLPHDLGVYAALCAGTAFLMVGHRSVYASQKLGLAKSGGLEVPVDVSIGELRPGGMRIRRGSLTESVLGELEKGVSATEAVIDGLGQGVRKGVRKAARKGRRSR